MLGVLTKDWFLEMVEALDSVLDTVSNRDMVMGCGWEEEMRREEGDEIGGRGGWGGWVGGMTLDGKSNHRLILISANDVNWLPGSVAPSKCKQPPETSWSRKLYSCIEISCIQCGLDATFSFRSLIRLAGDLRPSLSHLRLSITPRGGRDHGGSARHAVPASSLHTRISFPHLPLHDLSAIFPSFRVHAKRSSAGKVVSFTVLFLPSSQSSHIPGRRLSCGPQVGHKGDEKEKEDKRYSPFKRGCHRGNSVAGCRRVTFLSRRISSALAVSGVSGLS